MFSNQSNSMVEAKFSMKYRRHFWALCERDGQKNVSGGTLRGITPILRLISRMAPEICCQGFQQLDNFPILDKKNIVHFRYPKLELSFVGAQHQKSHDTYMKLAKYGPKSIPSQKLGILTR